MMAFYGPPPPCTEEEFWRNGGRDPGFEAWRRDCARQNTVAFAVLLVSVGVLLAVGIGAAILGGACG